MRILRARAHSHTPHGTMGEANDAVYDAWFRVALGDSGGDSIKGKQAVGFFGRSGLDKPTLARVWALADYDRGGAIVRKEVCNHLARETTLSAVAGVDPEGRPETVADVIRQVIESVPVLN